ncbi:MAG: prepilin-type N-terminal cleavage/methylation domain-containing protein [Candidatus Omnitrophica bacterium]|nr:prepilin-type N-terminal cleavage/methylation domain-containing protein [Candidatus Omnitrophota bacterium]MCA9427147.1 prepilin-type N-terminal cleavage/methylation domain-containing protein [Candidatus Omnitrophota bacterium]
MRGTEWDFVDSKDSGFTLIELLIVIAIILILIAIALPNFLEAQVRAKVTASRSNMRSIEVAMHSLYLDIGSIHPDYNDYGVSELRDLVSRVRARIPGPTGCANPQRVCSCQAPFIPAGYRNVRFVASAQDFYAPGVHCPLTTPIAYMDDVEVADPFGAGVVPHGYDSFPYYKNGKLTGTLAYGAVFGIGPDGIAGDWLRDTQYTVDVDGDGLREGLPYSPTNGTKSHGDFWRVFAIDTVTANNHYNNILVW